MNQRNQKLKPRPRKGRGFVRVSQAALSAHPKSAIFQKALYKHQAVSAWDKAISQFFEGAENQTKAADFKDGVLFIACLSKELAYKIKMFAQRIIYLINQLLGRQLVFALQVEY